MKTASQIISHLVSKPQYQNLVKKKCFIKVIKLLPPHLSQAVMFTYTKNTTLFVVLNHPGFKMEFHYKDNLIKSLLKQIKSIDPECKDMPEIKNIKYFVSNKIKPQNTLVQNNCVIFKERAKGNFEIKTEDKKLKNLFLKIKEAIKKKT